MERSEKVVGTWWVLLAFVTWGLLPIYWKALASLPPMEILAHRIFWSFVFTGFLVWLQKRWQEFKATFKVAKNRNICLLTAAIIGSNWFIYIWAVINNHIVDTSLGYFINPLDLSPARSHFSEREVEFLADHRFYFCLDRSGVSDAAARKVSLDRSFPGIYLWILWFIS